MKRGILLLIAILLVVPFVNSQSLTINDLFDSRILSYSSDKVMVPEGGVFNIEPTGIIIPSQESTSVYYYTENNLIASSSSTGVKYHYLDRLGSDMGTKTLPFGQEIIEGNRFSFTGKEFDEDLYYFGARYYDANLGKFTSVDPVKDNQPYSYVRNNPLNLIDPDGREVVTYTWTAPTSGSAVDFYVSEGQFAEGPYSPLGNFNTELATFDIADPLLAFGFGLRVAGVDTGSDGIPATGDERQGPWSETSDTYYGGGISGVGDNINDYSNYGPLPPSYPNPASDRSNIVYYVPRGDADNVLLQIFDLRGALIREAEVDGQNQGYNEFEWDLRDDGGRDVASGVYLVRYSFTYRFEGTITNEEGASVQKYFFTEANYVNKMTVIK
jgi:RHS repeat-associated protein